MKRTFILLLGLCSAVASVHAQEKAVIPPRYRAIEKTPRIRLLEVYGSPEVQPGPARTGAYAAAGKWAVFASEVPTTDETTVTNSQLFVWDTEQRAFRKDFALDGRTITALALSADGTRALLGAIVIDPASKKPAFVLILFDLAAGKEIRLFGSHKNPVYCLAIASDGKRALSGSMGALQQWDLDTGKELAPLPIAQNTAVAAVAYLPDGKQALSGWAGEIRLWDLTAAREKRAYQSKKPGIMVYGLAVAADGKRFASADYNVSATLWETVSAKELAVWSPLNPSPGAISSELALVDEGTGVIACWGFNNPYGPGRDEAIVCRFDDAGKETWTKTVRMQGMVPVRLDGKDLHLGGGANPFRVWDAADGKEQRRWGGPKGPVAALAQNPAGTIVSASNDGMLYLCKHGQQASAWRAHDAAINVLATSHDRKLLLTASADKTVKLHDAVKGTPVCTLAGHTGNVTSVVFGPGDSWAASGSDDRTVILWDVPTGKKRATLEGHAEGVNAVAVSPRGDWLASASNDNTIRLWPLKDGKPDADRDTVVLDEHKRQVTCVTFSPDGKQLLSASQDRTLKLWDVAQPKVVRELRGHTNWISAVIFQGPGHALSASDDLTVRLWDLQTGKELDRIDLAAVADGPRSLISLGADEFAVGTSGWVVMRFAFAGAR